MPKVSQNAHEQSIDSPINQVVNLMAQEVTISTNPVFICGVNRKINIGNFENINLYVSQTTQNVCASEEASQRYQLIKQAQNNH